MARSFFAKLLLGPLAILLLAAAEPKPAVHDPHPTAEPPPAPAPVVPDTHAATEALDRARESVTTAGDAVADATGRLSLLLTGALVIAAVQIGVLVVQVIVLYRSIAIVETAAASRNRPRLVVRHANLEVFESDRLAKVHWLAENMGTADATILEAYATLAVIRRGTLPAMPQYDQRNHAIGGLPIEIGRTVGFVQFSMNEITFGEHEAVTKTQTGVIFLYGYLIYEDAAKTRRRTGFCRLYDAASGRFTVFDDPHYEYSD